MPLWVDACFYDVCARNVLQGGIHYRDVFDTNFPGMVWGHALVRTVFGWRPEALRLVDLGIFAAIVWLLVRQLRNFQVTPVARVWTGFALFAFYFSLSEWCHCQRDVWMLFLALWAVELRLGQVDKLATSGAALGPAARQVGRLQIGRHTWVTVGRGFLEGLLWGAAVWIKPFVMVPAGFCWLVSVRVVTRAEGGKWRLLVADAAALLAGGLAAGAAGAIWLVGSGAWPYFWDIMLRWNPEYQAMFSDSSHRYTGTKTWALATLPWSLVHLAGIPLALFGVFRALAASPSARLPLAKLSGGGLLAALYLGWLLQAGTLQNCHDYVLTPAVLIGLVVCVAFVRLSGPGSFVRWLVVVLFAGFAADRFELFGERLGLWGNCFTQGRTPELTS